MDSGLAASRRSGMTLDELKLVKLPVFGPDPAHRTADRTHHDSFRLNNVVAEPHAGQHGTVGDPGRGEEAVAPDHVGDLVFLAMVLDAHAGRAFALLVGIDDEPRLHLPAGAAERGGGEDAFGCT